MNIETKLVSDDINEYLRFGWEHTDDTKVRTGRTLRLQHVLARDKDMENYRLIAALEAKYFMLKSQKKTYVPMDGGWGFVLFMLFVIPFILYAVIKHTQKKRIEEHNAKLQTQMNDILIEVKTLL